MINGWLVSQSTTLVWNEKAIIYIGWIALNFSTYVHCAQMMYLTDCGDLIFPQRSFESNVSTTIRCIAIKFVTDIHASLRMISNHFGDPQFFLQAP